MRPELIGPEFDVVPEKYLKTMKEGKDGIKRTRKHNESGERYSNINGEKLSKVNIEVSTGRDDNGDD